ncbi:MAG TPA: ABC transporter ATP-binding protein [Dehalococcoidia bacterium]|nr:ABC transporter ATP-binding protein [Dehalococcoidia bacterium]
MTAATEPVLEARDLRRTYGRHKVLNGVSFAVRPGELVGIVGENGAGKSTLLKILAGELRPDTGDVLLRGGAGYCPQLPVLNEALSVQQHLDYFAAAYALHDLSYADALVQKLAFSQYRAARVGALSGGTRQKLNLTLALMHRPGLLLLDEPYQGFDWETYLRFWDLALDCRAQGVAVLVISHLLFERERFDRIAHLRGGRIEEYRP